MTLQSRVTYVKMHTLLLNGTTRTEFLKYIYSVSSTITILNHIENFTHEPPSLMEAINNIYELPIIESSIRYLHGAACLPTNAAWIKRIRMGNYFTWPFLTVKNVNKFYQSWRRLRRGRCTTNANAYAP